MEITLITLAAGFLFLPGLYALTGAIFTLIAVLVFALLVRRYPFSKGATGAYYLGESEIVSRGQVKGENR